MGYKDKYKNMSKSNLTFLNANGDLSHREILANIQKELDAELAKISYTDPQGDAKRATAFATAENKIKAENARWETEKSKRMDDLFGNIRNVLGATQTGLSSLGIQAPPKSTNAPIGGSDNYQQQQQSGGNNTLLIVGGVVVVLGLVGFAIYKSRN
jgi:membrane protein involved in colicin uptake